jgi:hypothetical protein
MSIACTRLGVPVAIASWRGRSGAHDITHIRLEDVFGSRLAAIDYELEAQRGKHPPRHLSSESSSRDTRRHFKGLLDRVDRQTDLDRVLVKRLGPDMAKLAPHVLCSQFKLSAVDCEPHAASFVAPLGPVLWVPKKGQVRRPAYEATLHLCFLSIDTSSAQIGQLCGGGRQEWHARNCRSARRFAWALRSRHVTDEYRSNRRQREFCPAA